MKRDTNEKRRTEKDALKTIRRRKKAVVKRRTQVGNSPLTGTFSQLVGGWLQVKDGGEKSTELAIGRQSQQQLDGEKRETLKNGGRKQGMWTLPKNCCNSTSTGKKREAWVPYSGVNGGERCQRGVRMNRRPQEQNMRKNLRKGNPSAGLGKQVVLLVGGISRQVL